MTRTFLSALAVSIFLLAAARADDKPAAAPAKEMPGKDMPALDKPPAVTPKVAGPTIIGVAGKPAKAMPQVGWMELSGPLREGPAPFALFGDADAGASLRSIVAQLQHVAASPRHKGVVIYLDQVSLTQSQISEISEAVQAAKEAGKKVIFFAEAYDFAAYQLACSGSQILLQQNGFLEMTGIGIEEMYLAGLLEKIGIKADFVQTGKYKGADEQMTRREPSKEWSENFDNLLDDLYGQMLDRVAASRRLTRNGVERLMRDSFTMSDRELVQAKAIDRATKRDMTSVTGKQFGDEFEWDERMGRKQAAGLDFDNPFAIIKLMAGDQPKAVTRDSIALIQIEGVITSGESAMGGMFGESSVGSSTILQAIKEARDHDKIKGIVLRINSPGGSALASEVIWQAVREAGKVKPVYVSVGSLAASGGYYIACAGDKIYASPSSILGSIGVVSGKLAMGGLYEWAGVGITRRSRGPLADMFNSVEPFTPEQRKAVAAMSERIYDQFTGRVKAGRGKKIADIAAVAQGRLFTGRQCVGNGLADNLGGVEAALADLAGELGLKPGKYDIVDLPGPMSFPQFLSQMLGVSRAVPKMSADQLAIVAAAKAAMGPRAWAQASQSLQGLMLLRSERVLTLMPHAVVVK